MQRASTRLHSQKETCRILKIGTFLKSNGTGCTLNRLRLFVQHHHLRLSHIQLAHEPTKKITSPNFHKRDAWFTLYSPYICDLKKNGIRFCQIQSMISFLFVIIGTGGSNKKFSCLFLT